MVYHNDRGRRTKAPKSDRGDADFIEAKGYILNYVVYPIEKIIVSERMSQTSFALFISRVLQVHSFSTCQNPFYDMRPRM